MKKFISIIWGYHRQLFSFESEQNYHMLPIEILKQEGYDCEIFAIGSQVHIEDDPHFIPGTRVIYYTSIFQYFRYLWENRNALIYSNTLTIKTLLVGLIGKRTIFMAHDQSIPSMKKFIKKFITLFFYRFFSCIRVINQEEFSILNKYHINSKIVPLAISDVFYSEKPFSERSGVVFIGNLYHDKNPEFLLDAMKLILEKHPDVMLHIYGEDRYDKDGKNFSGLVEDQGLSHSIIIHGFAPHATLKKELPSYAIYINTSLSEGQCLTAYEAALAGCFLCLQDIIAFPSVFGENALYHHSPDNLSQNVLTALENPQDSSRSIRLNQDMILRDYSYSYIKKQTRELFLSIL